MVSVLWLALRTQPRSGAGPDSRQRTEKFGKAPLRDLLDY